MTVILRCDGYDASEFCEDRAKQRVERTGSQPFCWGVDSNVIGGWLPPFTLIFRHIGISRVERAKMKSRKNDMLIASPVVFFLTRAL